MFKNGAYYNGIGPYLKEKFGMRIAKVSVDGGFTCPNRDGTAGFGGCIFCSESGSGDFAGTRILGPETAADGRSRFTGSAENLRRVPPVAAQMEAQIGALRKKWGDFRCIAYFQNFTNTYAPVPALKERFEAALEHPLCAGLAVATRPDCLGDDVLDYLSELNERTFLWVELGLQTADEDSARYIRRGYPFSVYEEAVKKLSHRGIPAVTHLIAGLPGEDRDTFLRSVSRTVSGGIFGIKLQLLHIMKSTDLGGLWQKNPAAVPVLEKEEYISLIADALEIIPPQITIHRLTGDAPKDLLLAPLWSRDKKSVLNGINMELKKRGSCQGSRV